MHQRLAVHQIKILSKDPETHASDTKAGVLQRFRTGLDKTRGRLASDFGNLLLGEKEINDALLEKIESGLLLADLGLDATENIMTIMVDKTRRRELNDIKALGEALRKALIEQLQPAERQLIPDLTQKPFVILFVGVNGAGKTTTIGKLGNQFTQQGLSVLLAAGDTFRAAASEQLQRWGERMGAPVITQPHGADPAAVIFDAMEAAKARNIDLVLADTAGRLQNKGHLMAELAKIRRIMERFGNGAPHEVLLVLEAGTGRNGLRQASEFQSTVGTSGLVVTKLDGTAKGGFIAEAATQTGLPIYYVGVGEDIEDLQPFSATLFVDALFADLLETR